MKRRTVLASIAGTAATVSISRPARATTVGVTKTEIKIGSTTAFSGPASAYPPGSAADTVQLSISHQ